MKRGLPDKIKPAEETKRTSDVEGHFLGDIAGKESKQFNINVDYIKPRPDQPRKDTGDLTELVDSIREKGILEPLIVRKHKDVYQIVAGERRYRAFLQSGRKEREIPCVVIQADERQALEISLVENLQRKDLDIWEEAETFKRMSEGLGYTQEEISKKIGKSKGYVSERMEISKLPLGTKEKLESSPNFGDLPNYMIFQAVRANRAGKLNEYTEMLKKGEVTSGKETKKAVEKMVNKTRGRKNIKWLGFKYGNYKLNRDRRGNFLITIKCKEEGFKNSLVNYLKSMK